MDNVFWITPSSGRLIWFVLSLGSFVILVFAIRLWHKRRTDNQAEKELLDRLIKTDLLGKSEEKIIREIIKRQGISPPVQILSSLQYFDQIAQTEIHRAQHEPMPFDQRIDLIEYLYSIRIQAFAYEPAISGTEVLELRRKRTTPAAEPLPEDDLTPEMDQPQGEVVDEEPMIPTEAGQEEIAATDAEEEVMSAEDVQAVLSSMGQTEEVPESPPPDNSSDASETDTLLAESGLFAETESKPE